MSGGVRIVAPCARTGCPAELEVDVHYTQNDETVRALINDDTDGEWGYDHVPSGDEVLHCPEHRS